jgi:hypothetical protein
MRVDDDTDTGQLRDGPIRPSVASVTSERGSTSTEHVPDTRGADGNGGPSGGAVRVCASQGVPDFQKPTEESSGLGICRGKKM